MHICPPCMHIKYLVILTCSFQMAAILVLFFDLHSCLHRESQKLHVWCEYSHMPLLYADYILIIVTYSSQMAAILVLFFDLLSCHAEGHRDFISLILMYVFFTFIHKRNNATVAFFLKFMIIIVKSIDSVIL